SFMIVLAASVERRMSPVTASSTTAAASGAEQAAPALQLVGSGRAAQPWLRFPSRSRRVWLSDVLALTLAATLAPITSGVDPRSNLVSSTFFGLIVIGSL